MPSKKANSLENLGCVLQFLASLRPLGSDQFPEEGATVHRITVKAFKQTKRPADVKEIVTHLCNKNLIKIIATDGRSEIYASTEEGMSLYNKLYRPMMEQLGLYDISSDDSF